ncbi:protein DpdJ [Actinoplanes sp. NPDC051475]|uniref:protein DpdJ n=1 Tax=Actinoplanes sp. NPDC051475 TaxID=3157225 RepID=UPI00344D76F7
MVADPAKTLLSVLDTLEDIEARHLVWGLTEESWSQDRLIEAIGAAAPADDPRDVLEQLLQHNLVFELDRRWPKEYRTRMAETMRLMAHLRQLFPGRPWQGAPSLVADFRFRHEPRLFPERNLDTDAVAARLTGTQLSDAQVETARQILNGPPDEHGLHKPRKLSEFQLKSTIEVFAAMAGRDRGVVVSAGTGSGKTLAFYLPALAHLATRPASTRGVGVVAIYPRNELLKDQLASALDETRRLRAAGGRQIRIGAYFGNSPKGSFERIPHRTWRRAAKGWACPFLTCPAVRGKDRCGGELVWLFADYDTAPRPHERLTCTTCGGVVADNEVVLTRNSMQQRPPDLLFTTTEMLNRSLSDGWSMHVFGVGPSAQNKPKLVLLDEVHTYEGTNGAQVAYLLRRWRRLLNRPTTWVGLSATLANADRFFEDLCGLDEGTVVTVEPDQDHLEPRGREYQVVLRGDPAQQTALLSTTIQSLMLLRRALDPQPTPLGAYGSRVFAFCDNLDSVNRLYRQMLSAEGLTERGHPRRNGVALAALRMMRPVHGLGPVTDWDRRDGDGQHWWMPELLGFDGQGLRIGRTSSQDTGVRADSDIVVTTSSLEVGFDDPTVGAVLQHKAPRDVASFLQRRGRAGRTQTQRPWTVVVLSDFGRDRTAYQDYETLLAPDLPEKRLPMGNQSVRKMQAAMCLIDWVAYRLDVAARPRSSGRSARQVFIQPDARSSELRDEVAKVLTQVMNGGPERQDLMTFVAASLQLSPDELEAVCWEQPRSLMLDAVPTARRRLVSRWAAYVDGEVIPEREEWVNDSPLPEFIPKALFSDLCLPEVAIDPPPGYDQAANESIAVHMALNELAPGKVTMRWAVDRGLGLWIEPADDGAPIALEDGLARDALVIGEVPGDDGALSLVRPLITAPQVPKPEVQPSSNGRLHWQVRWQRPNDGLELVRPRSGPLVANIVSVRAYLHTARGALQSWRYGTHTSANVVRRGGGRQQLINGFTWHGQPAAVGYDATVDAQVVAIIVPQTLASFGLHRSPQRLRQLRRDFFVDQLRERLHALGVDPFLSRNLADSIVAAAAAAIRDSSDPAQLSTLAPAQWRNLVSGLLHDGVIGLDDDSDDDDHATDHDLGPRQRQLLDALTDGPIAQAITETAVLLTAEPDDGWVPWLRTRFVQTMAAAWQAAAQELCPDFDADLDSVIDVDPIGDGHTATFVLSDAMIGGGGMIEALTSRISDDPRQFDYLVVAALQPSDLEEVDRSLRHTLALLTTESEIANAAQRFRTAADDRLNAWQHLVGTLLNHGVSPAHVTVTTLASRVFRARSGPESDNLIRKCLAVWEDIEVHAGFAIDHRSICMALSADPDILATLVKAVPEGAGEGERWAQSVLQGLLWPTAEGRRAQSLVASNRFVTEAPMTERTLVLDALPDPIDEVDVDDADWIRQLTDRVAASGRCQLISGRNDRTRIKQAIQHLVTNPVDLGWLHVHPHVEAASRRDGRLAVDVSLEEAPQ